MSAFEHADELLPGLLPAAFRGVPFHAPNATHEVGRRIIKTYFPGIDTPAFDDLGRHDGFIDLAGLVVGDDYVARAEAIRAALQAPGPGTLFHPWLGEITVAATAPAVISFDVRELRVARFQVTFERVETARRAPVSTLAGVLSAASALTGSASRLVAGLLGGVVSVAVWSASRTTATEAADRLSRRIERSGAAAALGEDIESALTAVRDFAAPPGRGAAVELGAAVAALPGPVARAVRPRLRPAIGAAGMPASPRLKPERGAGLLLSYARDLDEVPADTAPEASVRLAAQAAAVAAAVGAATEIAFESRQQAIGWLGRLGDALGDLTRAAGDIAPDAPDPAARIWSDVAHVRAQLARDMHEIIGRLPPVRVYTPAGTVSGWLIAQHFAGDDPQTVTAMLDDIVRRNRLRHPGAVAPEPVEILVRERPR